MTTSNVSGRAGFDSRTVRIFISSTFRDFAIERDLLVRKVFPELRRRCRERQVELVDVDLRWGITEAEAEQGKVLPICLAEIDRARPFFMGLHGERYGWVPAAGQFDRSLLIEQPWLEEHAGGKSVTELEVLHGVLNNPQMAGRAFFYFRDPAWSLTQGVEYTTGSELEREKLADLKDRIRTSGFPVVEDYSSPETLADRVREDLWTLIDAAYPEAEVPDPLTLEWRRHEAYAASRRRLYLGGERYFEALDAEMAAESPRPVLIRGKSGSGKSALLANWLARWSQAHPDTAVIVHHLGCGADAADPVRMAVRIMQEIAQVVGTEFEPKSDPDEQLDDLATWLATAASVLAAQDMLRNRIVNVLKSLSYREREIVKLRYGLNDGYIYTLDEVGQIFKVTPERIRQIEAKAIRKLKAPARSEELSGPRRTVLIVLDGLDKLSDRRHLRWFPTVLPPGVRLVASCLDGEVLHAATPRLPWRELVVEPFSVAEQTQFIGKYLGRFRKQLTPKQTRRLQSHPLVGNPLFLLTILEELRVFGVHEKLDERLTTLLSPPPSKQPGEEPTVDDAFEHVLTRIETDHGAEPVQRVMEAIWASRAGLYTDEILAIAEVPPATWAGIANALDESLYENSGRINFGHDYLRKAVEDRYAITGDARLALHRRLAEYFNVFEPNGRIAEELPWQWRESHSRDELRECLTNLGLFSVLYSRDKYELLSYWVWLGDDVSAAYEKVLSQHTDDPTVREPHIWNIGNFLETAGYSSDFAISLRHEYLLLSETRLGPDHQETLWAMNNYAQSLSHKGDYPAAHSLFRDVLARREVALGLDHPDTLSSANNLAVLLNKQGDHAAAESMYRRVTQGREQSLGPDHPDTLSTVMNLAHLLRDKGEYPEAESLYRRAHVGFSHALGATHPLTLASLDGLANLHSDQGNYSAAEPLYRQALNVSHRTLGPRHPATLSKLHNLAMLLRKQGNYAAAEPLHRDAVERCTRSLGPGHPQTLASLEGLATLLMDQGHFATAEPLLQRILQTRETLLGSDHTATLGTLTNLAGLSMQRGDSTSAERLTRRVLEGRAHSLGETHPDTLDSAYNLAVCLEDRGEHTEAEVLYRRALDGQAERLGPEHPTTLRTLRGLASLLSEQGDESSADALFHKILGSRERTLGPDHPDTLVSVQDAAVLLERKGDFVAAEGLYRRVLEGREGRLGPDHPHTLIAVENLANLLRKQADYTGAEPLYCRLLNGREKALGPEHPSTLATVSQLASLLCKKGDYAAAIPMHQRMLAASKHQLDQPHVLPIVHNLAQMHYSQGEYTDAEPLYRSLIMSYEKTLGVNAPETLGCVGALANILSEQGNYAEADALYRRDFEGCESSLGPDHPDTLMSMSNLAVSLGDQGKYADAEPLCRRALEGRERILGPDHPDTLTSVSNLAILLIGQRNYADAEPLLRRFSHGCQALYGRDDSDTQDAAERYAECVDALTPLPQKHEVRAPPGTVTNSIGMKFVRIPAGEFLMGSPEDCRFGDPKEEYQHRVRITKPFLLGMHQVTQSQYEKVVQKNPSYFKGPDLPVEHLTWKEACHFCELLSALPAEVAAGRRYRLPTEAEWEYACRAGTTTTFNTGDSLDLHQARFATMERTSPKPTAPVGSYPPNAWGLYDMHGNVWEWTADWFSAKYFKRSRVDDPAGPKRGTHHTLRGGSASVQVHECRSAIRGEAAAADGPETESRAHYAFYGDFGIRVVCQQST